MIDSFLWKLAPNNCLVLAFDLDREAAIVKILFARDVTEVEEWLLAHSVSELEMVKKSFARDDA